MSMIAQEWTVSGLSVELGVDRRTIAKRLSGVTPVRTEGKSNYYLMADVVRAIYADQDAGSLEAERTRLTKAQADKTELEVETMRKNLLPADEVLKAWQQMIGAFRARCLGIPTRAAHAAMSAESFVDAESVIKDYIHEALTELSNYDGKDTGETVSDTGSEDGSATA